MFTTASIRPQASKKIGMVFTIYTSAALADPKLFVGFTVVSTTCAANSNGGTEATDVIGLTKTTATNNWSLYARKASGTSEKVSVAQAVQLETFVVLA